METSIISQIAQKVFYKNAKVPDELQAKRESHVVKDKVTLSSMAVAYKSEATTSPEVDPDRQMHIERIKSLVQSGNYQMNNKVIEDIAEKIVKSFM